mmetsp:Transcript_7420/g.11922  ORF Transcript_7420/g.11922 Transcript_7420/m.11922 type:complete len:229 (+) Transcript_7420:711-1397(+)
MTNKAFPIVFTLSSELLVIANSRHKKTIQLAIAHITACFFRKITPRNFLCGKYKDESPTSVLVKPPPNDRATSSLPEDPPAVNWFIGSVSLLSCVGECCDCTSNEKLDLRFIFFPVDAGCCFNGTFCASAKPVGELGALELSSINTSKGSRNRLLVAPVPSPLLYACCWAFCKDGPSDSFLFLRSFDSARKGHSTLSIYPGHQLISTAHVLLPHHHSQLSPRIEPPPS